MKCDHVASGLEVTVSIQKVMPSGSRILDLKAPFIYLHIDCSGGHAVLFLRSRAMARSHHVSFHLYDQFIIPKATT
jgi:hypothetical protein